MGALLEFHIAANLFPMDDESLDELSKDIKKQGLQNAIEMYGGQILDGRRRYMACRMACVEPEFREVSPDDPIAYVLSQNLHRRQLTPSQKAMVVGRAREMYDQQAKERMTSGKGRDGSGGRGHKQNPVENLPQGLDHGSARDAAFGP